MNKSLKRELAFLLFLILAFGQQIKQESQFNQKHQQQHEFQKFKKRYGKSYDSSEHESNRFNIFVENLKQAERFKKEITTAQFGVTKFSDHTKEEFKSLYASGVIPSDKDKLHSFIKSTQVNEIQLPKEWDIRLNGPGFLQPIQNAGKQCNSNWAFAVTNTIEPFYSIKYNQNITLSVQQLVDCTKGIEYENQGYNGGTSYSAYMYVFKYGLALNISYPYLAKDTNKCRQQTVDESYKIKDVQVLPDDTNAIKQALVTRVRCLFNFKKAELLIALILYYFWQGL